MSLVVKYSESPVKLMENQKLVEIQFPDTATEIIGLNTDNLTKIDVSKCSKDFVNTVKSSYSEKPNNVGGSIKIKEQPNNEIWYEASAKLIEITSQYSTGFHPNEFNVTMISHTFEDGKGVITFDGEVTSIGVIAFQDCTGLTSVTIPDSVTEIGASAFSGCKRLTSIVVSSGNTVYDSRNTCNAIIKTTTNELIAGCKNTIIPDSVTSIGGWAFYGCSGLESVTIPDGVTSIGGYAFNGCKGLTSITCNPVTPPTLGSNAIPSNVTTIYVPSDSVDAYKTASGWSSFASKITAIV